MADLHGFKFGNPGGDANLGSHFQVDYGASRIDHVFDVKGIGRTINHARAGTGSDAIGLVATRPARATMREVTVTRYHSGDGQLAKVWKDVVDAKSKQVQRAVTTIMNAYRAFMADFIKTHPEWGITPAMVDESMDWARREIREEVLTAAYGSATAQRALADLDKQLQRAMTELPNAGQLAMRARSGRK